MKTHDKLEKEKKESLGSLQKRNIIDVYSLIDCNKVCLTKNLYSNLLKYMNKNGEFEPCFVIGFVANTVV